MYFKQMLDERCGCASYLVASRQSREAAIVDPSTEIRQYEALLRERNFKLQYVIDTHVHADHLSGARALGAAHGAALCLHESAQLAYPFRPLKDGGAGAGTTALARDAHARAPCGTDLDPHRQPAP